MKPSDKAKLRKAMAEKGVDANSILAAIPTTPEGRSMSDLQAELEQILRYFEMDTVEYHTKGLLAEATLGNAARASARDDNKETL